MIGTRLGRYQVLAELGAGGMGVVYLARDTRLDRDVAIKVLPPGTVADASARERLRQEALALSRLNHPGIAQVYDFDTEGDVDFLVMEHVPGKTLEEILNDEALPEERAIELARQLVEALEAAHLQGVFHRDVKPGNVKVTPQGKLKVLDFGLAALMRAPQDPQATVALGSNLGISGTFPYMAPEQLRGETSDARTDVYAAGVVLYEMLTGRRPHGDRAGAALIAAILDEKPPSPRTVRRKISSGVERVVQKALEKDPTRRYARAGEMAADLASVASGAGFARELLRRGVLHVLVPYVVVSAASVLVLSYVCGRLQLSPHLPRLVGLGLLLLAPGIAFAKWSAGKRWGARGPVFRFASVNLLAALVVLALLFRDKDLGAMVTSVRVEDENGVPVSREIPKAEFRKHVVLYHLENRSEDPALDWLRRGFVLLLTLDLYQDPFLDLRDPSLLRLRLEQAGVAGGHVTSISLQRSLASELHCEYFTTGSFRRADEGFSLTLRLHESRDGAESWSKDYTGPDAFVLIDQASLDLRRALGIPASAIEKQPDLPVSEMTTTSWHAFENFARGEEKTNWKNDHASALGYYEAAAEEDSTFVSAHMGRLTTYLYLQDKEGAAEAGEKTLAQIYRIPERLQFIVKVQYYVNVQSDFDRALRVAQLWASVFPADVDAHLQLASLYFLRNKVEEAVAELERVLTIDPARHDILQQLGAIYRQRGNFEAAERHLSRYAELLPTDHRAFTELAELYEVFGKHDQAREAVEKALVLAPTELEVHLLLSRIEVRSGRLAEAVTICEEQLPKARSDADRSEIHMSLYAYLRTLGRLQEAVTHVEASQNYTRDLSNPLSRAGSEAGTLAPACAEAGDMARAREILDRVRSFLKPPYDLIVSIGEARIQLEAGDTARVESLIQDVDRFVEITKMERLRNDLAELRGRLSDLNGDHDSALGHYRHALAEDPQDASLLRRIARSERLRKHLPEAREALERSLALSRSPHAEYEMALLLRDEGKPSEARERLAWSLEVWKDADPAFRWAREARALQAELAALP